MANVENGKKYVKDAEKRLKSLSQQINQLRDKQKGNKDKVGGLATSKDVEIDWKKTREELQAWSKELGGYVRELGEQMRELEIKDLQHRLHDAQKTSEKKLKKIRETGEKRWLELQTTVEHGLWDIRSGLQRAGEGADPFLHIGSARKKTRYYLQHNKDGRWGLFKKGASAPSKLFSTKSEGVREARRYVRDRRPAELVIRRADGTFEHILNYTK